MLSITNVSKKIGNNQVLKNINLEINDSSIYGIVGINGIGKSTLLRCISGIYSIDEGSILLDGEPIYENPVLKQDIFIINDDLYFPINFTVNDLKKFYANFYVFDEAYFRKLLSEFDLNPNLHIKEFSKGMKYQAMMFIALAIRPKLLILDEAFDGLDLYAKIRIKQELINLVENHGSTIIITSHSLREIEDVCDQIGLLENMQLIKNNYNVNNELYKYQMVFKEPVSIDMFDDLNYLDIKVSSRIVTLILDGDPDENLCLLRKYDTVMIEKINLSLEEKFIIEIEKRGYRRDQ